MGINKLHLKDIFEYVEKNISFFHQKRIKSLEGLKLHTVLKRKNPYLFKAKNVLTAQDLVSNILNAYLSSQEEAIFGEFLEGLAIFICGKVYGGKKAAAEGIDLEFEKDKTRYIVSIKSGPNWGNANQIRKMKQDFNKTKRIIRTNSAKTNIIAVNGCCYGHDNKPDKGEYFKFCGQEFWCFISGSNKLYTDIIKPLGHKAKEKNESFNEELAKVINRFTLEFMQDFCVNGSINWDNLVQFNSSKGSNS